MSKKSTATLSFIFIIVVASGITLYFLNKNKQKTPVVSQPTASKSSDQKQQNSSTTPSFDKTKYSIDQPGSIWWIVNKKRALPEGYVPSDLVVPNVSLRVPGNETMQISKQIQPALQQLFDAMKQQGYNMYLSSGYRSYQYQVNLYNGYVAKDGQAAADKYSARPGTSEHQTGLAFDIGRADKKCELEICFGETPEGQWLKDHAHEYGFIIRYPSPEKEPITGYQYEPWHLRYVGVDLATELHNTGQTMEEFFGLN